MIPDLDTRLAVFVDDLRDQLRRNLLVALYEFDVATGRIVPSWEWFDRVAFLNPGYSVVRWRIEEWNRMAIMTPPVGILSGLTS